MTERFRKGVIVREPFKRLSDDEIKILDKASKDILANLGLQCFNEEATDIFSKNGCTVTKHDERSWLVKIPADVLTENVSKAPTKVILGARDPENRLILDADTPRIYFGSGSETNIWLDAHMETFVSEKDPEKKKRLAVYTQKRGNIERLCTAARLA